MDKPVKAAFERDLRIIPVEDILPMRQVEDRVLRSVKYRRIARSIAEVGVIEPLVVARPRGQGPWMLLDGHVRLSILKELAAAADDDDDEGSSAEDDGADETSPWPRPRPEAGPPDQVQG